MLPTTTRSPSPASPRNHPQPQPLDALVDRFMSDLLQELQPIDTGNNSPATASRAIRVEPATPEPGLVAPVDLQALVEERNHLMDEAIALSAHMPPDSDLPAITRTRSALQAIQSRIAALDIDITRLLEPDDADSSSDSESDRLQVGRLQSSASKLEQAIRLFQIAELEGRLRDRGTRFEPGQLGVIRHDSNAVPFPAQEVLELARLHAADNSDAGTAMATRLLAQWSTHVAASWDLREIRPALLEDYADLADTIAWRRSSMTDWPRRGPCVDGSALPEEAQQLYRFRGLFELQKIVSRNSHNADPVLGAAITWPHVIDRILSTDPKEGKPCVVALALELQHHMRSWDPRIPHYLQAPASRLDDWIIRCKAGQGGEYPRSMTADRSRAARDGLSEICQAPILDPSKKNFG